MPRPNNKILVRGGLVYSVSPRVFKEALASLAAGGNPSLDGQGKLVGTVDADLTGMSAEQAKALLATFTPPAPVATATEAAATPPAIVETAASA